MPFDNVPQGILRPPRLLPEIEEEGFEPVEYGWLGPAPGTMILVFIFLAAFITYFFVNWKMLSLLWKIG